MLACFLYDRVVVFLLSRVNHQLKQEMAGLREPRPGAGDALSITLVDGFGFDSVAAEGSSPGANLAQVGTRSLCPRHRLSVLLCSCVCVLGGCQCAPACSCS